MAVSPKFTSGFSGAKVGVDVFFRTLVASKGLKLLTHIPPNPVLDGTGLAKWMFIMRVRVFTGLDRISWGSTPVMMHLGHTVFSFRFGKL